MSTRFKLMRGKRPLLASVVVVAAGLGMSPAHAQIASDLEDMKKTIQQLQRKIEAIEAQQAQQAVAATPAPSAPAATAKGSAPTFSVGPMSVTLGGFVELMVVNRSKNEAADWASNFNASIPYPQSHNFDLSEFHVTERQSRVSALVQSPWASDVAAEGYLEVDFGAAPSNGNNNESASFSPRVRHLYADYQRMDSGWYLLFGQTWSLVTGEKHGMMPRDENIPLTIDGQYMPGFNWIRVSQVRLVKQLGDIAAVGISAENPAALVTASASAGAPAVSTFFNTQGAASSYAGVVTTDYLPDFVAKLAIDPRYGHYEIFATDRSFRSRSTVTGLQNNQTSNGVGGGLNMILPLIPKMLDVQVSFLGGKGVGRYGSSQLADATVNPADGSLSPIKGYQALAGLTYRPTTAWTFYAYAGTERLSRDAFTVTAEGKTYGYGYGSALVSNAGCDIEGSDTAKTPLTCTANTSAINQVTLGGWWKFYQGALGNAQIGASLQNVKREIFTGIGGDPSTNINIGLISFRYYPWQK